MFVLNPAHKEIFEAQIKHIVNVMWVNEFSQLSNAPEGSDTNNRRNRFGLRGNRYLNVIAELYGYESYSELLRMANSTSNESPWVNNHLAFSDADGLLHEKVLRSVGLRCSSSLVGCQNYLADSFVEMAHQLQSSIDPASRLPSKMFEQYPFIQLINSLPDVYIQSKRKDEVCPMFFDDGEIEEDETPYYSLYDINDKVDISPYFSSLDDMEAFFKKQLPLYSKYTIDITPCVDENVFNKVGNYSGYIWNS